MEEMLKRGLSLGGEQSGHIIFSDHLFTGDGIVTALSVLRVMAETGRELADLAARARDLSAGARQRPRAREEAISHAVPAIAAAMAASKRGSPARAGCSVRYSGTEPLLRVMIEGRDQRARFRAGRRRSPAPSRNISADATAPFAWPGLSVNVNKVATLRNSRGGNVPSVVDAARRLRRRRRAGHHRSSARRRAAHHVRRRAAIAASCAPRASGAVEFNIEGDPRPDLLALVHEVRPDQCTLVPVAPGEMTSQAGWVRRHAVGQLRRIVRRPAVAPASASACSSIRIRPRWSGPQQSAPIASSSTRSRSRARFTRRRGRDELRALLAAWPRRAHELGLGVNAGHDLDLANLTLFRDLPHLDEVSIGHALISHALYVGLDRAVRDYIAALGG